MADDGIDQKNLLLEIVYREITDKGNYLSIEGKSLSVQDYLKDWNTDNLYQALNNNEMGIRYMKKF